MSTKPLPPFIYGQQDRKVEVLTCVDCKKEENDWEMCGSQDRCVDCNWRYVTQNTCRDCHQPVLTVAGEPLFNEQEDGGVAHVDCKVTPENYFCKHCEDWGDTDGYDDRYHVCGDCADGYYSDCTQCEERTAHDDMIVSKGCPIGPCKKCYDEIHKDTCIHCGKEDMKGSYTGTKACGTCCKSMYRHCNGCEKNMLMTEMRHVLVEACDVWACAKCDIKCQGCKRAYVPMNGELCTVCRGKSKEKKQCDKCKCEFPLDRYSDRFDMCNMCARGKHHRCESCGVTIRLESWETEYLCKQCNAEGKGSRCQGCLERVPDKELISLNGEWSLCEECTDKKQKKKKQKRKGSESLEQTTKRAKVTESFFEKSKF